jgi:hypothetical protein
VSDAGDDADLAEAVAELRAQITHMKRERARDRRRISALEDELDDLRGTIARLTARVDPHPESVPYAEKSRAQKVHELRVVLARKARDSGGQAMYRYSDVMTHFGEYPSPGHAYRLMELAADYDADRDVSRKDGYEYGDYRGSRALRATWSDITDEAVVHAVKNGGDVGGVK